jgi:ribose-phosphate pyrophosphokinase
MDGIRDMAIVRSVYIDRDTDVEYDNEFAKRVHSYIEKTHAVKVPFFKITNKFFNNKEIDPDISDSVRGLDVYLIHQFLGYDGEEDPNVGYAALILAADALMRADAERINIVIPSDPYERGDRKVRPRIPISAKAFANVKQMYARKVMRIDMHAQQEQGFYDIPVDNLEAMPKFVEFYKEKGIENYQIISPDSGGTARASEMATCLTPLRPSGFIDKRRPEAGVAKVYHVVGEVNGMHIIEPDDMIDTAGTMSESASALKDKGALSVSGCAAHGVLSKYKDKKTGKWESAEERIMKSDLDEAVITDTINRSPDYFSNYPKIKQVTVSPLIGEAIWRTQMRSSVSALYKK